ncbi:MAG: chloride channel protein, partial [Anaerolineales bacterium]|nr:chloride channel protein [Anaerolineales bacterium]
SNELTLTVVGVLLFAKILATCLTLGSGGSGGVFAPSLFMGAMLGAAFELSVNRLFPGVSAPPGAYALVGMAAVFAATSHAPITAVLILFELTGDYRIILPLMLTVVVATLLSQWIMKGESIYTLKLSRRGVKLARGRDLDILQGVLVQEVMERDLETVQVDTTMGELVDIFSVSHHHGVMILDEHNNFQGVVTLTDLEKAQEKGLPASVTAVEIGTTWPSIVVAYPDETMGDALARMGGRGLGRLPVVARADPYLLLGLIWREGITRAYTLALTRRTGIRSQTNRLTRLDGEETVFVEIPLVPGDEIVGNRVAEIAASIPKDCVLVSIQREGRIIIPHGDTRFKAGDKITAFVRSSEAEQLKTSIHGQPLDDQAA